MRGTWETLEVSRKHGSFPGSWTEFGRHALGFRKWVMNLVEKFKNLRNGYTAHRPKHGSIFCFQFNSLHVTFSEKKEKSKQRTGNRCKGHVMCAAGWLKLVLGGCGGRCQKKRAISSPTKL